MFLFVACRPSEPQPILTDPGPGLVNPLPPEPSRSSLPRPARQYELEDFAKTLSLKGISFSFDESSILYSSNRTGIYNAFTINLATGQETRLTDSSTDAVFALAFFPGDNRVLYSRDQAGDENRNLFVRNEKGEVRKLSEGEKTRELFLDFSDDGESLFTANNQRHPAIMDVYERDLADFRPLMIFANDLENPFLIGPISRDKHWLALTRTVGNADSRLFLHDLETGRSRELLKHDRPIRLEPQFFGPDSNALYYLSNDNSEFSYLARLELETGRSEVVLSEDWDIESASRSEKGTYLTAKVNRDGKSAFRILALKTGAELTIPRLGDGQITELQISPAENLIALYFETDVSGPSLHLYDPATNATRLLISADNPEIDQDDLVHSELIRFTARDGLEIPGYLYRPHQAVANNRVPAVIWVHGGPGSQTTYGYQPGFQFLVNRGYAVFAINNRGSSGYGKTFYHADDRRHGREPLFDCVDAKNYLQGLGWIAPDKIAIMGRSYGGFMVLAALAFTPEEFAAGVDIFGVSNWVRTLESMPPYWKGFREHLYAELGRPVEDRDQLMAISPLFHADRIVRPLLVIQGENDVRVLKAESDEMVQAIRKKGGVVEYLVVAGEGHGFNKTESEILVWNTILSFLDRRLKGITPKKNRSALPPASAIAE